MFDTNIPKIRLVNKIDQKLELKACKTVFLYKNLKGTFLGNRLYNNIVKDFKAYFLLKLFSISMKPVFVKTFKLIFKRFRN